MATWTAYYDASGQQSDAGGLVVVSGVVSTDEKWQGFNPAWDQKVLRGFGIPYLHMTEFTKCEGAFAFLKGDQEKQSAILDSAAKTTTPVALLPDCSIRSMTTRRDRFDSPSFRSPVLVIHHEAMWWTGSSTRCGVN
jgi:hypothetical protein